jgi:hypothetical protein
MALEHARKFSALERILEQEFPKSKQVSLRDMVASVSKVSNVRVRTRTVEEYYELGIDDVNEAGVLVVPEQPKKFAPANASAIESQRLHRGDLIFGYRGKMGKVGLVDDEFDVPVVTNNGMIRIRFPEDRREDTPRYVQTYLETPLIRTFLDSMLEDRNGVKVLDVKTIESLPIPYFDEMAGVAKFSTLINRRKSITQAVKKVIEEAEVLLHKRKAFESEAISLQARTLDELSKVNSEDHMAEDSLKQLKIQLERLANIQPSDSVLLKEFV